MEYELDIQQLEREADDMYKIFYEVAGDNTNSATDKKVIWNCVSLALGKIVQENDSFLQMAELHMDQRAITVTKFRLYKLGRLIKLVHDKQI